MSQAGQNRVGSRGGVSLLSLVPGSAGAALDSGIQMCEAIGFKTWQFQFLGAGSQASGYSVTVYGTFDRTAYEIYFPSYDGPNGSYYAQAGTGRGSTLLPATSWFQLPGPSEQSGTGLSLNPVVSGTSQVLVASLGLVAVRAVATIIGTPTNGVTFVGFAIP
jgi:hypothetical protein